MNRRYFCQAALASGVVVPIPMSTLLAQGVSESIGVRTLNHVTLSVSDVARSVEFYQRLFGMAIQARQDSAVCLQIGSGPQFITVAEMNIDAGIHHYCLGVDDFDADEALDQLGAHGVTTAETLSPMTARVRMRGPELGGAEQGTPELYLADPDGILVQLQQADYCGGGGSLGALCSTTQPSPEEGVIALRDLNHVTISVSDRDRSTSFYQEIFDMPVQAYQGVTPALGIGLGTQFVTVVMGAATGSTPGVAGIAHVCMTMEQFDPDEVTDLLADLGIEPISVPTRPVAPLRTWVKVRPESLGGAPGGTPELYFTDPDGIFLQIQDVSYCGGAGYLGDVCP